MPQSSIEGIQHELKPLSEQEISIFFAAAGLACT